MFTKKTAVGALIVLLLTCAALTDSAVKVQALDEVKLYLSPASASVSTNDTLTLSLREDSGAEPVNVTSTHITFSPSKLQFLSITASEKFSIYDYSYGEGLINVNYQATFTPNRNDQLVATVKFKVIASSGSFNVTLDPIISTDNSSLISSDSNTNILTAVYSRSYNISQPLQPTPPPPTSQMPGAETQSDTDQSPALTTSIPSTTKPPNNLTDLQTNTQGAKNGRSSVSTQTGGQYDNSLRRLDEILLSSIIPVIILAALLLRAVNRKHGLLSRHETVADFAARIDSPHMHVNETVAEVAARINERRINNKTETVAELAARIPRLAKKKTTVYLLKLNRK